MSKIPLLARFAVAPRGPSCHPELEIDPSTALLRRLGVNAAFVDELEAAGNGWHGMAPLETVLSESNDPIDPDLVRAGVVWAETRLKKIDEEADPDLVRGQRYRH